MRSLALLWLPILLSAVSVFVISSLIHMVFKWHASDYRRLPDEDAVRAAVRRGNPAPGTYVLPHCNDMKEMGSEAMLTKYREGPVGYLTLRANGAPAIGQSLVQWFVFSLVVAAVAAVLAGKSFGGRPDADWPAAQLVGITCFVAYGFGSIQQGIWDGRPWSSVAKYLLDAALYAAASAGIFWWLWP